MSEAPSVVPGAPAGDGRLELRPRDVERKDAERVDNSEEHGHIGGVRVTGVHQPGVLGKGAALAGQEQVLGRGVESHRQSHRGRGHV